MKTHLAGAAALLALVACSDGGGTSAAQAPAPGGTSLPTALPEASPASPVAPAGVYQNDPAHTRLLWRIGHMGLSNYTARVNDVAMTLDFDPDNLEGVRLEATIDPRSVDTAFPGEKDFEDEISSPLILNAGAFPTIRFTTTSVRPTGARTAEVTGDLTLHGVTKPVTLEAVYNGSLETHPFAKVPAIGFTATTTIDRTDFGIDFLSGKGLADQVDIEVQAEFLRQSG